MLEPGKPTDTQVSDSSLRQPGRRGTLLTGCDRTTRNSGFHGMGDVPLPPAELRCRRVKHRQACCAHLV